MIEIGALDKKQEYYYFTTNGYLKCMDVNTNIIRSGSTPYWTGGILGPYRFTWTQSGNYMFPIIVSGTTAVLYKINLKSMNSVATVKYNVGGANINTCHYCNNYLYYSSGNTLRKYDIDLNYVSSVNLGYAPQEITSDGKRYLYVATTNGIKKVDTVYMAVTGTSTATNYTPCKYDNGYVYAGTLNSPYAIHKYDKDLNYITSTSSAITWSVTTIAIFGDYLYTGGEGNNAMRCVLKYNKGDLSFVNRSANIGTGAGDNVLTIEGFSKYVVCLTGKFNIYNLPNLTLYKASGTGIQYCSKQIMY